jgi:hypothetical protein
VPVAGKRVPVGDGFVELAAEKSMLLGLRSQVDASLRLARGNRGQSAHRSSFEETHSSPNPAVTHLPSHPMRNPANLIEFKPEKFSPARVNDLENSRQTGLLRTPR